MTETTDRVKLLLDTMKGSTFTNERAIEIVKMFNNSGIDTERTLDEEAGLFLLAVTNHVRAVCRRHKLLQLEAANDESEQTGADDAVTDL